MKDKRNSQPVVQAVDSNLVQPTFDVPSTLVEANAPVAAAPLPKLSDLDKMALDLAKEKRKTVLAEAKTAIANNDAAELGFKNVILQLYMKYGLNANDAINENGDILINGAVEQPAQTK
jgi:hypothetical protein